MEITEVRTREDMINNLKANGNYSKFKQKIWSLQEKLTVNAWQIIKYQSQKKMPLI